MAKTIFDPAARDEVVARIASVDGAMRPRWGKMNAQQMLAHLVESMRMATGEVRPKSKKLPIRYTPLRQLIVYLLPFPKGAPTVPELMPSDPRSVDENRAELQRLVREVSSRADHKDWPEHPAFGNLSRRGWGVLVYRHADHHLRQFGV
ncbi:MAG: DUF1569 domain-containing protein [Acidobacteriota bacterium]|nr:DUF1569 domain-containing protein [Acidobacteriota bacterium]